MTEVLLLARAIASGRCPMFYPNAHQDNCLFLLPKGVKCPVCNLLRAMPAAGRKLVMRWRLAKCSDDVLMAVLHDARTLVGD